MLEVLLDADGWAPRACITCENGMINPKVEGLMHGTGIEKETRGEGESDNKAKDSQLSNM